MAEFGENYEGVGVQSSAPESSSFRDKASSAAHASSGTAKMAAGQARKRVFKEADQRKSEISKNLDELAQTLSEVGEKSDGLSRTLSGQASQYVRQVSGFINGKSSEELVNEASQQLKNRPGAVVAGLFALGFLTARMARS